MGSHCSQAVQNTTVTYEEKNEINNTIQEKESFVPIFTGKLNLNVEIDKGVYSMRPCNVNDSVLDITTERNQQEQIQQNQLLSKKYFDDTMTINKSHNLVYSNMGFNILSEIIPSEVVSQKQEKQKKVEECDEDYDQMCRTDLDQFKFQQPAVMKYVDKQIPTQQKTNTVDQRNLRK
ncbi:unnamed protein product (macronuclear) [Paramecium tetraurelia]|uniref:Uncharacterized protein n=1 Tax=Paramecium tetraurelia TaxID=5888 RepID=A0C7T5_PARTE|nr:uncharacterized protein GSPATT00035983001 [Paramecium tetraurelia]CAK66852.1 unnamed protein product [Paramecium tetraurelia]|eukprot:XP_001434249.1 hypothetical protein (macronuclear) [Paramecium tetraurelia strain d4-2]